MRKSKNSVRPMVAMAAAAVVLWFAATVQAQPVTDFIIDPTRSWFGQVNSGFQTSNPDGTYSGGNPFFASTAQNPALVNGGMIPGGSLNASINGHIYASVNPGTSIQFVNPGGSLIHQVDTGNYIPGEDGGGNVLPGGLPPQPGNWGAKIPVIGELERTDGQEFGAPFSASLPTDPLGNFDASGVSITETNGIRDRVSGIESPAKITLGGNTFPINLREYYDMTGTKQDTLVPDLATIDLVTLQLILPFKVEIWTPLTSGGMMLGYYVSTIDCQIVADPVVPEPSSAALFGIGAVGLSVVARRMRKRAA